MRRVFRTPNLIIFLAGGVLLVLLVVFSNPFIRYGAGVGVCKCLCRVYTTLPYTHLHRQTGCKFHYFTYHVHAHTYV